MLRVLVLIAAGLAATPAVHAQQAPAPQSAGVEEVGIWHISPSAKDCVAITGDTRSMLIALIYSAPDKHRDAALMITSKTYFTDAKDGAAYPVRLVLAQGDKFDNRWGEVKATGMVLKDGEYGIRIAAPAADFTDSLGQSDGLILEGIGRGSLRLDLQDMHLMVAALRRCALSK